ncbi:MULTISPECIES: hypothetical protein [Thermomonosporaceae]|uniref:hypothetical protein n=1 Tax=Thermomonosporaceae TaxID=2012 RepID=UPI00255AA17B|nr:MULTISPECIES: hypothetical protein [Thermomonosporaceae]MDL4772334.1 hypothetical protein [Actinomadura xylanilytica]
MKAATRQRRIGVLASATLLGAALIPAASATADTAPGKGLPATVTAEPLPTWQVNGVVWSMVTVGNTVYATGNFTKARPPGTAEGNAKEVARRNILAFDLTTGNLITSFNHSLNGQGLRIVASPDGKRVYVGGEFTTVDGQARSRIAAFDTATGKLVAGFAPKVSNKVRGIAASNSTVYIGGNFFNVNGKSRTRLAAVKASNGANIDTWKPTADDDEVMALALAGSRVIVGGKFQKLNGTNKVGIGAVNTADGSLGKWTSRPIPTKLGKKFSYVTDLFVSGDTVFGSANGEGMHWYDGRFAAKTAGGALMWLDNCYGATYGVFATGQTVYSVSHAHNCESLGAFPDTTPETNHRTLAETRAATGTDKAPPGTNSNYSKQPVPTLLHWFPTLAMGSFTKQYQAAWAITGNANYLALGGEFPRVNGKSQQGLVRFGIKAKAPNKSGPVKADLAVPKASTVALTKKIKVSWKSTWDMDNRTLKYEVLRDKGTTAIGTLSQSSAFWTRPELSFTDANPPAGKHTYRIRVTDPLGNSVTSDASGSAGK